MTMTPLTPAPINHMIEGLVDRPDFSTPIEQVYEATELNPIGEALYFIKECVNSRGDRRAELLALLPDGIMPNQADALPGRMSVTLDWPYGGQQGRVDTHGSSWTIETDYEAELLIKAMTLMQRIRHAYEEVSK